VKASGEAKDEPLPREKFSKEEPDSPEVEP
jgi:hypothetical protein